MTDSSLHMLDPQIVVRFPKKRNRKSVVSIVVGCHENYGVTTGFPDRLIIESHLRPEFNVTTLDTVEVITI